MEKLRQFFNGCHTRDVDDGVYAKVLKNASDARKARIAREKGEVTGNRRDRRRLTRNDTRKQSDRYKSYDRDNHDKGRFKYRDGSRGEHRNNSSRGYKYSRDKDDRDKTRRDDRGNTRHDRDRSDRSDRRDRSGHAHHVSLDRQSRSRSRHDKSRSRSRSRDTHSKTNTDKSYSPSSNSARSPSPEQAFHMQEDSHKRSSWTNAKTSNKKDSWTLSSEQKQSSSSRPSTSSMKISRWQHEVDRPISKFVDGKRSGYGSFFNRQPYDYSTAEYVTKQGHYDRIRTADCRPRDKDRRKRHNDDSDKESDWLERTSQAPPDDSVRNAMERANREARERKKASANK